MKQQCEKQHVNILCKNVDNCCEKGCVMRHPKPCRFFERNNCKFDDCAYSHRKDGRDLKIENLENQVTDLKSEVKELSKTSRESQIEVKNLLQQVADISNNMKGVIKQIKRDRKQQESYNERSEVIEKKMSNEIKEDIKRLKATNEEIIEKIKLIEEESWYETDEDSEIVAETEGISSSVSKPKVEIENKNPGEKLKCEHCDFVGQTKVERSKHVSTKHPIKSVETADDMEGVEGIDDMFQIEYLEGEQVYACNICDEGFEKETEIRDHIVKVHNDIVTQITDRLEEEEESRVDEIYGESV